MKRNLLILMSLFMFILSSCKQNTITPESPEWCCDMPEPEEPEVPAEERLVANKTATYSGDFIDFEDNSGGNSEDRLWKFEGGSPATSTDKNPSVTYATPGRYEVELLSKTANGSNTYKTSILVVPSDKLIAFFPFNGNTKDFSPTELSVTTRGEISFRDNDRLAKKGGTSTFDGASGLIATVTLGVEDYSISCWVKSASTSRMMIWQESGKNAQGDPTSWFRMGDNSTTQFLRFHVGAILNFGADKKISDDIWHHTVCIREGASMRIFLDGVKIGEQSTTTIRDVTGPDQVFKIGVQENVTVTGGFQNYFTGNIDDFIIYRKALTDAEVKALFEL